MKKVISVLLIVTLVLCVFSLNTFATSTDPSVAVFANESSPQRKGESASFTVRLANIGTVKGLNVVITLDGNASFNSAAGAKAITTEDISLERGFNYTVTSEEIRIVDLTSNLTEEAKNNAYVNFNVTATATADAKITITGEVAKTSETVFTLTEKVGNLVYQNYIEGTKSAGETADATLSQPTNYFIPYGGVLDIDASEGDILNGDVFIKKNIDGTFTVPMGDTYVYTQVENPENNIITFATSTANQYIRPEEDTSEMEKAVLFMNYVSEKTSDDVCGTMVIAGDWEAYSQYFVEEKGKTNAELIAALSARYDKFLASNSAERGAIYTRTDGGYTIYIAKYNQVKKMWQSTEGDILEYALKVKPVDEFITKYGTNKIPFAAVAYREGSSDTEYSQIIKTVTDYNF